MPGPAFNWLCVAHSVVDILSHAAEIKAAQLSAKAAVASTTKLRSKQNQHEEVLPEDAIIHARPSTRDVPSPTHGSGEVHGLEDMVYSSVLPTRALPALEFFPTPPRSLLVPMNDTNVHERMHALERARQPLSSTSPSVLSDATVETTKDDRVPERISTEDAHIPSPHSSLSADSSTVTDAPSNTFEVRIRFVL